MSNVQEEFVGQSIDMAIMSTIWLGHSCFGLQLGFSAHLSSHLTISSPPRLVALTCFQFGPNPLSIVMQIIRQCFHRQTNNLDEPGVAVWMWSFMIVMMIDFVKSSISEVCRWIGVIAQPDNTSILDQPGSSPSSSSSSSPCISSPSSPSHHAKKHDLDRFT